MPEDLPTLKTEKSTDTVAAQVSSPRTPNTVPRPNSGIMIDSNGKLNDPNNTASLFMRDPQVSKKIIALSVLNVLGYAFPVAFNFALMSYKRGKGNEALGGVLFTASFLVNLLAAVQLVYRTWARFATVKDLYEATIFRQALEQETRIKKLSTLVQQEAPYLLSLLIGVAGGAITVAPGIPLSDEGLQVLEYFRHNSGFRAAGDLLSAINTFTTRFVGTSVISYQLYTSWLMKRMQPERHFLLQVLADVKKYPDYLPDDLSDAAVAIQDFYQALAASEDRDISPADKHRFLRCVQISCALLSQAIDPLFMALTQKGGNKINDNGWADHPGFVLAGGIANSAFYTLYSYRFPAYVVDFFNKFPGILRSSGFLKSVLPIMCASSLLLFGDTMLSGAGYAQAGDEMIQPFTNVTGTNATLMDRYGNFGSVAVDYWMFWANPVYTQFARPIPFFGTLYGLLCMVIAGLLVNGGMVLGFLNSCADEHQRFDHAGVKQPFWKVTLEYLFHGFNLAAKLPVEIREREDLHKALESGRVERAYISELQEARAQSGIESVQVQHSCWDRLKFWKSTTANQNDQPTAQTSLIPRV